VGKHKATAINNVQAHLLIGRDLEGEIEIVTKIHSGLAE